MEMNIYIFKGTRHSENVMDLYVCKVTPFPSFLQIAALIWDGFPQDFTKVFNSLFYKLILEEKENEVFLKSRKIPNINKAC